MGYITLGHLHRQYINYLGCNLDFTGTKMVLTQKIFMIGFNLYDDVLLANGKESQTLKKCKAYALKDVPGLIEFLGYTFCFSNLLAGPTTEYATYLKSIDGSTFQDTRRKIQSSKQLVADDQAINHLSHYFGVFLKLSAKFPVLDPTDPQNNTPYILTEEFFQNSFYTCFFHAWVGLFAVRQKYYFGWKNAEGAQNIWHAGFEGYDNKGNEI